MAHTFDPGRRRAVKVIGMVAVAAIGLGAVSSGQAGAVPLPPAAGSAAGVAPADGSLYSIVDQIGARQLWNQGFTGRGINVAVIDTGVAPVDALSGADKVVAMVDLSSESGVPEAEFLDTYGHGTHMTGIIAGRDPGATTAGAAANPHWFMGIAPDAGIVSVKVGDNTGYTDVSQVIAGVDWVTDNAAALNIRVISLSYGSGSTLPYTSDPLTYAVERAWRAGIVVVVAAGNDGRSMKQVGTPANDPYVIAVAAAERKSNGKWKVPAWATSGDGVRNPDFAAPGASVQSLRAPNSRIDLENPTGRVTMANGTPSPTLFKGSGSSQAAAVTAGAVALLLSAKPTLTPNQVKGILRASANGSAITPRPEKFVGQGLLQLPAALNLALASSVPAYPQTFTASTGTGSLSSARGGEWVLVNGTPTVGSVTTIGTPWSGPQWPGQRWSDGTWDGAKWTDGTWMGAKWTGAKWTGAKWTGAKWTGAKWTDASWTGAKWTSGSWTSGSWTGAKWTGAKWTGAKWTDASWTGAKWTGAKWTDAGWF
jgi:serine protease AprX